MTLAHWRTPVRLAATALLVVWAGFWLWFSGMVLTSEWDGTVPWEPLLKVVLPIAAVTGLGLAAPRVGGLLLIAAALFAGAFFDNTSARLLMALPMLVIGASLVTTGPWVRRLRARSSGS